MRRSLPAASRLTLALLAVLALPFAGRAQETVYRVPLTGVVEFGLAPFIERSLDEAAAAGARRSTRW